MGGIVDDANSKGGNLHSKDGNLLARASLCANEGAKGSETGTHHRRGHFGRNVLRDGEGEVLMRTDMAGVATLRDGSVWVRSTVGILNMSVLIPTHEQSKSHTNLLGTVILVVTLALLAL